MLTKSTIAAVANLWAIIGSVPFSQPDQGHQLLLSISLGNLLEIIPYVRLVEVALLIAPLSIVSIVALGLLWVLLAVLFKRTLVLYGGTEGREFLGRPLIFPTILSHTRILQYKYNYSYSYFLIGVPVGLCGRVGNILSIDTNRPDLPKPKHRCLFTVDQKHYLNPGDSPDGLEGKLHAYLRTIGEDPQQWPYVYLISTPKFLWFSKNPVSWWFLYSPTRELSAMVMEANNSFGERNLIFFHVNPDGKPRGKAGDRAKLEQPGLIIPSQNESSVRFGSSESQSQAYKGRWEKDHFLSPFEKVEGYFTTRSSDPCVEIENGRWESNTTMYAPDGKPKIISRVYPCGSPLDPLLSPGLDLIRVISSWTHTLFVTKPRIVYQALRIRFRGKLTYLKKPEIHKTNVPRHETEIERSLEPYFRLYLSRLTAASPEPVVLSYEPVKSHTLRTETFYSNHFSIRGPESTSGMTPYLTVHPLTATFYTNILQYPDPLTAIVSELEAPLLHAGNSSRLWVSDAPLLKRLIESTGPKLMGSTDSVPKNCDQTWAGKTRMGLIAWLRRRQQTSGLPFMDRFVYSCLSPALQAGYQASVLRFLLTEHFSIFDSYSAIFGSYSLAGLYYAVGRILVLWLVLRPLYWYVGTALSIGFVDFSICLSTCILLDCAWRGLAGFL